MIHKYVLGILAVAALVVTASISAVAQVGELRGTVIMQQADGQKVPLADAAIDVFRTDMKAEYKTKTNKKGEFVFAGLPFVGTYTVAASHATAKPNFVTGVKAGRDIPVEPQRHRGVAVVVGGAAIDDDVRHAPVGGE